MKFLRVWLSALGWANDETNRNEVVKLIASDQGIDEEDAAKQLRRLPAEESMNLKGLEGVLDLRVSSVLFLPWEKSCQCTVSLHLISKRLRLDGLVWGRASIGNSGLTRKPFIG